MTVLSEYSKTGKKIEEMDGEADDQEPNFSDPEGYQDSASDEELVGDILRQEPKETSIKDRIIIIDGVPKVGDEKLEKLKGLIDKLFSKFGPIDKIYYPRNEENPSESKDFIFIQYASAEHAESAVSVMNGYRLDKAHTFMVNLFSDYEKCQNIDVNWKPPEPKQYKDHGNLREWLLSSDGYDQFVVSYRAGETVGVYENNPGEPTLLTEKDRWSESAIRWSSLGTYLATFHQQGVAIWGGKDFLQIQKFSHPRVEWLDFSPKENYLVTYAPPKSRYTADAAEAIRIWDTRIADMKRAFPGGFGVVKAWPHFKWSFDDKYFASMRDDVISIYESETFALMEKKSVPIASLRDFQWSPTDHYIAYWVSENNQIPARVAITDPTTMRIPERKDVRSKNLFNVADVQLHWQKAGDFCCAKIDRYSKKKIEESGEVKYANMFHNLEIFRLRDKDVPVETLEIKDPIQAIALDPSQPKLCVITGEVRQTVSFYSLQSGIQHLKNFEPGKTVNSIFWAPQGPHLVCAALRTGGTGTLVFFDTSKDQPAQVTQQDHAGHPGMTDIEWDPTGRFVVTAISVLSGRGDSGYQMWNFMGQLRQRHGLERFVQFQWRPSPPLELTEAEKREIKRNMKQYIPKFEEKDRRIRSAAARETIERRQQQFSAFKKWREDQAKNAEDEAKERQKLRNIAAENETNFEEEIIEFLVKEEEVNLSAKRGGE